MGDFLWWFRGMPETGLLGFVSKKDRDKFDAGESGPFRRVISSGRTKTIRQTETFTQMVNRLEKEGK